MKADGVFVYTIKPELHGVGKSTAVFGDVIMIKTARQMKDLIRNLTREKSADAQILMRNYMMERFLERISLSEYRDNFILKGGIRVSMATVFDGVVTPLKIDISTGDVITPRAVRYRFRLMLEERSIDIWAYNLETVLAEKLETMIARTITNTRMRDFYDLYILEQLHGRSLNSDILRHALLATARKRGTERRLKEAKEVFSEVENSHAMQALWSAYRRKFSYAADLEWNTVMGAVHRLYALTEDSESE